MLKNFRFLTSGESHGKCLNAIIDGIPAGFSIKEEEINSDLKKRQGGYGRGDRMKIEFDTVEIKSGIRFGKTLGTPICLEIKNKDYQNWEKIMSIFGEETSEKSFSSPRPGHADFAGAIKYDAKDLRNILERSSARKTAITVAIGSIAKQILKEFEITTESKIIDIKTKTTEDDIKKLIDETKASGDTLGGNIEIKISNLPIGLGSHVQEDRKLDGKLAQNLMATPAIKSVEIGLGKECANKFGSEVHDEIFIENNKVFRKTNNAGGIEGGITNGEDIIIKATMKPIPTLKKSLNTIDFKTMAQTEAHFERSDTCAVEACAIVLEAKAACVIVDEIFEKFGGDSITEIKRNYENRKQY
ncbi:MAG: chorismate synthase [bacterium]|nr:chorismate synthase [bacterium]